MTSILDTKTVDNGVFNTWITNFTNFLTPLRYLLQEVRFDLLLKDGDVRYLLNTIFWIFLALSLGYCLFSRLFQVFLKASTIQSYKRKQFIRSIWNVAFYLASSGFLYYYSELFISPQLTKNAGRLFPTFENTIFYKSQDCGKFDFYSLVIITFYLHAAVLEAREADLSEAASKILYVCSLLALDVYRFENYFTGFNITLGVYNIITEFLFLLALQNTHPNRLVYQIFLGLRIASWSHVFISLLPFKYLIPTLFAKNFKLPLNVVIWLWYGLSIWNSPVLQYCYHQIYHNSPIDCAGEGSAAKCILLRDSSEHRHFKVLRKAYVEVKLAHEKMSSSKSKNRPKKSSVKTFQAIKCILTLKRKLKRIREDRDASEDNNGDVQAENPPIDDEDRLEEEEERTPITL